MGFDLKGLEPATNILKPEWKGPEEVWIDNGSEYIFNAAVDKEEYDVFMHDLFHWQTEVKGAYFRRNVWDWRPLWELTCNTCADILSPKDCKGGEFNDGHEVNKSKAMRIGTRLEQHIESGFIVKYIKDREAEISNLPLETCYLCTGTGWRLKTDEEDTANLKEGVFTEEIAEEMLFDTDIPEGINRIKCNRCLGKGKIKQFSTKYDLDLDAVIKFAEFCKFSGGFSIC